MSKLGPWRLRFRMWGAMVLLFALIYIIILLIGDFTGFGHYSIYPIIVIAMIVVQYLIGPKIVEWSMHVKYVSEEEAPDLHRIVGELAQIAGIPKPKIGVSEMAVPNAFAFGRYKGDGRVCVTRGLLNILYENEVRAVVGHELAHIKHNDMIVTTIVSAIPSIFYWIYISFMFGGSDNNNNGFIIGIVALIAYFIGQLIVLFVSRVREYYADQGSIEFGNPPEALASALYKLVYGATNCSKQDINKVKGTSAFFLNNVKDAGFDIDELSQLDTDNDGLISASELAQLKYRQINVKKSDKFAELFSTHPNMLKRMERLAQFV
ncbi:zinc metalloprotease HtpX [Methanobrevibacter filiformis]|uniref:Protease HtpX homolog n=1 Tax=Methanobrevibacter filiformis TaxID=55758 RepID=A0A166C408_9EURY|nr:zinc metalloprotease HtpX [Methanobrevibacter filiformis]KZX14105.1 hypothetical protein MBFIL_09370 [Methanobrevibacter filiformis]